MAAPAKRSFKALLQVHRITWKVMGARGWFKHLLLAPARRWVVMGGPTERHPQHHTIWTAALGLFGALWAGLVFTTTASVTHGIGWASLIVAAYIFLSFFLPLWLPPIRDERAVLRRRLEHERQMHLTIAALRETVAQNAAAPTGSPLSVAQGLIARGSELLTREYANGVPSELPAVDATTVNEWLADSRHAMALHFAEQLYRVAKSLPPDATGAASVEAINQTMPALQNFRTNYLKSAS